VFLFHRAQSFNGMLGDLLVVYKPVVVVAHQHHIANIVHQLGRQNLIPSRTIRRCRNNMGNESTVDVLRCQIILVQQFVAAIVFTTAGGFCP
jgi:hypothetical protein